MATTKTNENDDDDDVDGDDDAVTRLSPRKSYNELMLGKKVPGNTGW